MSYRNYTASMLKALSEQGDMVAKKELERRYSQSPSVKERLYESFLWVMMAVFFITVTAIGNYGVRQVNEFIDALFNPPKIERIRIIK